MNEKNNHALVRRPSSAVEKAAPGVKRILSGMVTDTLALAKTPSFKRRGRLLIVDHEEGPRESLRVIFKDEYDLFMAEDGVTAIELAQQHDIDVVVTEIYMPGISGIVVLERLKYMKPDIEVIIMTGFETNDTRRSALRLGACGYINKPFDITTIRAVVGKAMQRRMLESKISDAGTLPVFADTDLDNWCQTGYKYLFGEGVAKDAVEAAKWFRKAAEQNHAKAQCALGNCYCSGEGVTKDYVEAFNWYRKAAEKSYAGAEFRLGYCYREGEGVAKDYAEAVKWFRRAAEHGSGRQAEYNLGVFYEKGEGVARDYAEAVKWYRKAAEKDHAKAQYNLGVCYEKGHGVQQNFPEAYKLYKLAANNRLGPFDDQEIIAGILKQIVARMTAVEIAEGERRIREFHPQSFE